MEATNYKSDLTTEPCFLFAPTPTPLFRSCSTARQTLFLALSSRNLCAPMSGRLPPLSDTCLSLRLPSPSSFWLWRTSSGGPRVDFKATYGEVLSVLGGVLLGAAIVKIALGATIEADYRDLKRLVEVVPAEKAAKERADRSELDRRTKVAAKAHRDERERLATAAAPTAPTAPASAPSPAPIPTVAVKAQHHQPNMSSAHAHVELLVHNVAHADMVLSLASLNLQLLDRGGHATPLKAGTPRSSESSESQLILARPRFSAFMKFSKEVLRILNGGSALRPLAACSAPIRERDPNSQGYNFLDVINGEGGMCKTGFVIPDREKAPPTPTSSDADPASDSDSLFGRTRSDGGMEGFPLSAIEMSVLRLRGGDAKNIPQISQMQSLEVEDPRAPTGLSINGVHFPLLSVLIPKFNEMIKRKYDLVEGVLPKHKVKKVIVLVTGVGTPRNHTVDQTGNSTEELGKLMDKFLEIYHPDIKVLRIHSNTNIFRYDENMAFVKKQLVPLIESYRDAIAANRPLPHEEADGVATSLEANPDWRQQFHLTLSFADGSTARQYAIQASVRQYRPTYMHFWQLKTFWHFEAVSLDDIEMHSFEDMEIDDPVEIKEVDGQVRMVVEEMKRFKNEFKRVGEKGEGGSDLRQFWLRKSRKPVLAVLLARDSTGSLKLYRGTNMEVSMPTGSLCAERNVIGTALSQNPGLKRADLLMVAVLAATLDPAEKPKIVASPAASPMRLSPSLEPPPALCLDASDSYSSTLSNVLDQSGPPGSPLRRINMRTYDESSSKASSLGDGLYPPPPFGRRVSSRKTVIQEHGELNPLKPCGSCNEWLKKIAEPNPSFKVITFTDSNCEGIYVSPVLM